MLTVGEILKKYREEKQISLHDIEKQIKIRAKFLQAVESNDWNFFSSKIYIIGIIKNYSRFLGLDSRKMLAFFRRDYERKEEVKFKTRISSGRLTPETRKVFGMIIAVIFILFFGYFGLQLKAYLSPPGLTIISPQKSVFSIEDRVRFVAKTDKDAAVTISGERVYQDKYGVFEYDLPLKNGKNILTVEIIGANGKKTIITKTFIKNNPF